MKTIERSRQVIKTVFAVLKREPKLWVFPVLASLLALVIAAFFIVPLTLQPTGHPYFSAAHWSALRQAFHDQGTSAGGSNQSFIGGPLGLASHYTQHWWVAPLTLLAYFVSMFLTTFCNVAWYHEIMQALNGGAVSVRRGFRAAAQRWQAIMLWSLFAGAIGYLLRLIEERVGFVGKIITAFFGVAWSLSCVFVIPTLVRDPQTVNPLQLLRNSAGTLRRTWGELVTGFIGLRLKLMWLYIPAFLVMFAILSFLGLKGWERQLGFGVVFFLLILPLAWISQAANSVYRCALYIYATEGVIPDTFDKEMLDSAWKVK